MNQRVRGTGSVGMIAAVVCSVASLTLAAAAVLADDGLQAGPGAKPAADARPVPPPTPLPPATDPPPVDIAKAERELEPAVEKILSRLEQRKVDDLVAQVKWELSDVFADETDTKRGTIWFKEFDPVAKFLVHFDKKIVDGRERDLSEKHMFDGRWYHELQPKTKTLIRREVRRENDTSNPYKIGEGPFPLPFGQKKADLLREFEIRYTDQSEGGPAGADHLILTPRTGTRTGRLYRQVDFWVAREGKEAGLPVMVKAARKDGMGEVNEYMSVTMEKIRVNDGFAASLFQIDLPAGYEEITERLDPPPGAARVEIPGRKP